MVTKLNIIKNGKSASFDIEENSDGSFILASDYEALKADRDAQQKRADALAVENAALKKSLIAISLAEPIDGETIVCDFDTLVSIAAGALTTPATDAALAAVRLKSKIEGVEAAANRVGIVSLQYKPGQKQELIKAIGRDVLQYAAELREAK